MFRHLTRRIVVTVLFVSVILLTQGYAANIKIACVQMKLYKNVATNRDNIISHIQSEVAQGTRVVVFCECALSDYSLSFIQTIPESTINNAVAQIAAACDTNNVYAIFGTPYFDGGIRYTSALVIDPNGDIIYRQDKVHAEPPTLTEGDKPSIFTIDGIPCTLFICHDERYCELMRMGVYAGAKIAFYISYEQYTGIGGWKDFNYKCQIVGRAIENQTWTVACNAPTGNEAGDAPGHSRIIGPDGTIHVEAGYPETVIRHTFDPDTSSNAWAVEGANKPMLSEFWEEGLRILQAKNPDYYPSVTAEPCLLDDIGVLGSSSNQNLSIALVQMKMTGNIATNASSACSFIQSQAAAGVRVVVFPECALTDKDGAALGSVDQNDIDSALSQVAAQCDTSNVYAIIGSPYRENGKLYNCAFVIDASGTIIKRHDQIHTDLPGVFDEGEKMSLFKIDGVYCTVVVGHDIHFPEFYRIANLAGAKLCFWISYEDASTPLDNSRFMAVCRAVESLTLSIFCNAGTGNDAGDSTGHSLIANKNSTIYVEAGSASDTVVRYTVDSSETSSSYAQRGYNHPTFNTFWQEGLDVIRMNNPEFYGDLPVGFKELKVLTDNWLSTTPELPNYSSNLVAYWALDENTGSYAYDSSVNINTGTLYNMDSSNWVLGYDGSALDFDGGNEYINVSDSDSISVGEGDFSIGAWIYPHSISGNRGIVAKIKDTMDKEYAFSIGNDDAPDGGLILDVEYNTNNGAEYTNTVVTPGEWQHVMVTFDSTSMDAAFYHNFQPVPVVFDNLEHLPRYFNDDLCIGRWGGSYNSKYFDGIIDEVKIYNCVVELAAVLPGDLDDNGIVDFNDFAIFAPDWGEINFTD